MQEPNETDWRVCVTIVSQQYIHIINDRCVAFSSIEMLRVGMGMQ
jgi:hypothetical protein